MLSQFSKEGNLPTLADLFSFPKDVYPVGRLDADSEGLLILTNDKKLNQRLLNPKFQHQRTYLVQVEGSITVSALEMLQQGITISVDSKPYLTLPSRAEILLKEPDLPERVPPIRFRKMVSTSWIRLTLHEGKNRQVRKMTAAVGFPTLRLVRANIGGISLDNMAPGEVKEFKQSVLYSMLFQE